VDREAAKLAAIANLPKDEAIKAALAHVDGVAENCDETKGLPKATTPDVEHLARPVVDLNPDAMPNHGLPHDPDESAVALDDLGHRQLVAVRVVLYGCSSNWNDLVARETRLRSAAPCVAQDGPKITHPHRQFSLAGGGCATNLSSTAIPETTPV
jgi:hypothetical protein